jgi:PD-(D/E)XK nuclease superfamily
MAALLPSLLTPAQRRVLTDLLAVDEPRPPADEELVADIRHLLEERTAGTALLQPRGGRGLRLNKTALDALDCEGRYLDHLQGAFSWSPATVLGSLVHAAIELDLSGRQTAEVDAVVRHAWGDFAHRGASAGEYLAGLGGVEADALRAKAAARLIEFRECFPPPDPRWTVRVEPRFTVQLHDGAIELLGRPDLVLGRTHATERRMLLIDLKTGRRSVKDRADMRFYALLATLKYGCAPFRVATYYLDEAAWDAEDVEADTLEAAARGVAERAAIAARLTWDRPPEGGLRLTPGPSCRWCARAPTCGARAEADAAYALASVGGP